MTAFKKFVTVGTVAMAMLAGSVPATSQVEGGDEECDYKWVLTGIDVYGTTIIPRWNLEVTCVRVLDDA